MSYFYELLNSSMVSKMDLSPNGIMQQLVWVNQAFNWTVYAYLKAYNCDMYAFYGAYAICEITNMPPCECLKGFLPKGPKYWDTADWFSGCAQRTPFGLPQQRWVCKAFQCEGTRHNSWFNESMNLEEWKSLCLDNCSCTTYTNTDIRAGGNGCLLWFDDLIDRRQFPENGQDLYVRIAASELDPDEKTELNTSSNVKKQTRIIASCVLITAMLLLGFDIVFYCKKRKNQIRQDAGSMLLDWPKRFHIINGIACGFGVLVLEMPCGERNRGFCHPGNHHSLLGHAWTLFMEGRSLEMIDASIGGSHSVLKCYVRSMLVFLCAQQHPEDRPSMPSVILIFGSNGALSHPKQLGFFAERNIIEADISSSKYEQDSANELSITLLQARYKPEEAYRRGTAGTGEGGRLQTVVLLSWWRRARLCSRRSGVVGGGCCAAVGLGCGCGA
ncbi:putative inactive G-type lectin S-receptor-like serine/threonine-protein kinase SRK [Malania oleifera]|uniref:putative inactive G-type lectin S-receptor-like serine/threonine-protein kinase SRK n=1 Tax=Malania oleifera TaxID=397392 RepID=UPI0025AE3A5D|nr:putative inactive G-type lectin S-receptor-like serine/threonine-protein kinase SRK [Malania oleifera]